MNNNDEQLPPELAAFEARLKTLRPVAFENARNSSPERKRRVKIRWGIHRDSNPALTLGAGILVLSLATAVSLMVAVLLFRPGNNDNPPHGDSGDRRHVAVNTLPEPPPEITPVMVSNQEQPGTHSASNTNINTTTNTTAHSKTFRGGVTMREQLAMLLAEMQPQVDAVIEPKQPDYPVMVIPVGHATRPLSPEAKQAFQRRLHGLDFEI